jgi:hypothetical protein
MSRRLAWMAHPLSGDIPGNLARAERWMKWLLATFPDVDIVADWILWCRVLDDTNPVDRERGLRFDEEIISRMDDFIIVGCSISGGVDRETDIALESGVRVVNLIELGDEPPMLSESALDLIRTWMDGIGLYNSREGASKTFRWRKIP